MRFANANSHILDLAAGSGGALNLYYDKVAHITAVEKFEEFSNLIVKSHNVAIINADIKDFDTKDTFDIVLLFGVMHYFSTQEAKHIYAKCKNLLSKGGKLIIKQQFGVDSDVVVEYSNELQQAYFSTYRYIENEKQILETVGFRSIEQFDIYDKKANRWDNTHFYALVCEI